MTLAIEAIAMCGDMQQVAGYTSLLHVYLIRRMASLSAPHKRAGGNACPSVIQPIATDSETILAKLTVLLTFLYPVIPGCGIIK